MNGLKKKNGTWDNFVSLKDYFESQLRDRDRAIEIAQRSMEKRLDGMNEFRDALKDAQSSFITRREHELLLEDIDELKKIYSIISGIQVKLWIIITLGGALALLLINHLTGGLK